MEERVQQGNGRECTTRKWKNIAQQGNGKHDIVQRDTQGIENVAEINKSSKTTTGDRTQVYAYEVLRV